MFLVSLIISNILGTQLQTLNVIEVHKQLEMLNFVTLVFLVSSMFASFGSYKLKVVTCSSNN